MDSGATLNFVSRAAVERFSLPVFSAQPIKVSLANGTIVDTDLAVSLPFSFVGARAGGID